MSSFCRNFPRQSSLRLRCEPFNSETINVLFVQEFTKTKTASRMWTIWTTQYWLWATALTRRAQTTGSSRTLGMSTGETWDTSWWFATRTICAALPQKRPTLLCRNKISSSDAWHFMVEILMFEISSSNFEVLIFEICADVTERISIQCIFIFVYILMLYFQNIYA